MSVEPSLVVRRRARLPDAVRVERCRRLPELGPRILFFSGGTALRNLSAVLKLYTANSIHLITPFDSGGSSALLRAAFRMPSVGDLRNRLMALADDTIRGNPEICRLFSHRFAARANGDELREEFARMVAGRHPLVAEVPSPMRRLIQTHLRLFAQNMPVDFDFRQASIGNLILAGGYLHNDRDLESVLYLFSQLVEVQGTVALTTSVDLHLAAELENGSLVAGQQALTGKGCAPIGGKVKNLSLVDGLRDPKPVTTDADPTSVRLIASADLICYPMGSFYSSVVANLLPRGIGRAIVNAGAPKVFIPNVGVDPEQKGMTIGDATEAIVEYVRRDAGQDSSISDIVQSVILDESDSSYVIPVDEERLLRLGVDVLRFPLVQAGQTPCHDSQCVTELLLSLC